MRQHYLRLCVMVFVAYLSSCASHPAIVERKNPDPDEGFWRSVRSADVIYVGETHDDPAHHEYERQLIRGMLARRIRFAVGWEMFEKQQQPLLDQWESGKLTTDDLFDRTGFQKRWAVYSPVYREILDVTNKNRIVNVALNASSETVRKVAHGESLSGEEQQTIPIGFESDEAGFHHFASMMGEHPGVQESDLRRFYTAQNLWDQTMATRILEFKQRNAKTKLVVFTGRGHVAGGYGIPLYIKQKQDLKQLILLPRGRLDLATDRKNI
jgi:uncharacterized iron-regulated protein